MTTEGDVEQLAGILTSSTAQLQERLEAAWRLGSAGGPRALEVLAQALSDPADAVRTAAACALGRLRDASALPALVTTLRDEHAHVRISAAWALGEIRASEALQPLVTALRDSDPTVRMASVEALGSLGNISATAGIASRLMDPSRSVRLAAAQILSRLGRAELLVPALEDPEWGIRFCAVEGLAGTRPEVALDPLVRTLLRRSEHSFVRARAAWALADLGDPRAAGALRRAYGDDAWEHRDAAREALTKLVGPSRPAPLLERLAGLFGVRQGPDRSH